MKITSILGVTVLTALAGLAAAQGYHTTGSVYATDTYMSGAMNNRYNTSTTTYDTYLGAYGYAGNTVSFFGRGSDGTYFSCYVSTSSALYDAAVDIKNNLTDGGYLYVSKTTSSSECTYVHLMNASYYLN